VRSHAEHEDSYLARLGSIFPDLVQPDPPDQNPVPHDTGSSDSSGLSDHDGSPRRSYSPDSSSGDRVPLGQRARRFTMAHMKVLSAAGLAAVILSTWMVMRAHSVPLDEPQETPTWSTPAPTPTMAVMWMIHVLGAVADPGVVSVPPGARVIDAIQAAGGLVPDADPGDLNLAAVLVDGSQILVGTQGQPQGEVRQGLGGEPPGQQGGAATGSTVNLNQATQAQLETLPGVGPVTAAAILAWREKNGSFTSVAQLQEVSGIGPKTYAQIEPYASV